MLLNQEFYLSWASIELFMALTHLFVLLGIRNSKLDFLRRKHNYFLIDGFTHIGNLYLYSSSSVVGWPLYTLWIIMVIGHFYYYGNLKRHPPPSKDVDAKSLAEDVKNLSRIFHWSCIEFEGNRFSISESGKEMMETIGDVVAHLGGFVLAFRRIDSIAYKIISLVVMYGTLQCGMLGVEDFLNDSKMMPPRLQQFYAGLSTMPSEKLHVK